MIEKFMAMLARLLGWEDKPTEIQYIPLPPLKQPVAAPLPVTSPTMPPLLWDTPQNVYHAIRVTCDNAGLTLSEKNIITACIYQESNFLNSAKCENKHTNGVVWSTDWGICQINDYFHIGPNKDFPSVRFVLDNPAKVVAWMIFMYRQGHLNQWVSFSSGAYKQWLKPTSPMWAYKTN